MPHIKGESYFGNSSYQPLYHDYIPIEFAVNGNILISIMMILKFGLKSFNLEFPSQVLLVVV